jgi:hypothetical protein
MPDETGRTDASDVLIAYAGSKWFWGVVILALIIWSGWASPEAIGELLSKVARAWRCAP